MDILENQSNTFGVSCCFKESHEFQGGFELLQLLGVVRRKLRLPFELLAREEQEVRQLKHLCQSMNVRRWHQVDKMIGCTFRENFLDFREVAVA